MGKRIPAIEIENCSECPHCKYEINFKGGWYWGCWHEDGGENEIAPDGAEILDYPIPDWCPL